MLNRGKFRSLKNEKCPLINLNDKVAHWSKFTRK